MNKIIRKEFLSENVFRMEIEAPRIAQSRKAGHFVIVRTGEGGERIPLTIADADTRAGTITLIVQKVGCSSAKLSKLNEGDYVQDVVGPLGNATHIEKAGTVLCAGGGVGVAPLFPIVQAFKRAGNRVVTVLAARTAGLLLYEKEMKEFSDDLILVTDDGSRGRKGLVTDGMEEVILRETVHQAVVIGPAVMMKYAAMLTRKYNIPTLASLNTIMVDGTGMCGACRCSVDGKTRFVCVDGPEFDAHQVDFDEMLRRMSAYREEEETAYRNYLIHEQ
ncbi:MAG: sulfide/dihydroorotate dehydrogenase-like FAD/NAD-binding protein [Bacteroidales bacterium]|jgi:ferredoxin--NADP+ reductase|nr:sulfide/dihydroorotate dehydrogenase-like FAD/NAD-binding protein [Bacteroidales bacterium]